MVSEGKQWGIVMKLVLDKVLIHCSIWAYICVAVKAG